MPPVPVSDSANVQLLIGQLAGYIGRSEQRQAVFRAVYRGQQRCKTAKEIATATRLTEKRVLTLGRGLASHGAFDQQRPKGARVRYCKVPLVTTVRDRVLAVTGKPWKIAAIRRQHFGGVVESYVVHISRRDADVRPITIEDIDSFRKAHGLRAPRALIQIPEEQFKQGFKGVVGETGVFRDWGGERGDLFTTELRLGGSRRPAVVAFKGPGQRGILTPGRMGKRGDQIQNLFDTDAEVFIVQYWGQVDPSVRNQLQTYAIRKALDTRRTIYYGVIDGQDSARLIAAYPKAFQA